MEDLRARVLCQRSHQAMDRVMFGVEPGEVLGCLSPNGVGKVTTLKLLPYQLVLPTGAVAILPRLPLFLFPDRPRLLRPTPS